MAQRFASCRKWPALTTTIFICLPVKEMPLLAGRRGVVRTTWNQTISKKIQNGANRMFAHNVPIWAKTQKKQNSEKMQCPFPKTQPNSMGQGGGGSYIKNLCGLNVGGVRAVLDGRGVVHELPGLHLGDVQPGLHNCSCCPIPLANNHQSGSQPRLKQWDGRDASRAKSTSVGDNVGNEIKPKKHSPEIFKSTVKIQKK